MRLLDDRVVAPGVAQRRLAARVLFGQGRARGLLAFRVADTHVHALLTCSRARAGDFARYAQASLQKRLRLAVPFNPARFRPVTDQGHLYNAFRYVLRQEARHGTSQDAAHDGSSLPELLGLRVLCPATAARVAERLPRLKREHFIELLGVDVDEPQRGAPLPLLADAAAAALAIDDLVGADPTTMNARRAAVRVARGMGEPTRTIAACLNIAPRTVQRLSSEPTEPTLVRAVRLQLRLRSALAMSA